MESICIIDDNPAVARQLQHAVVAAGFPGAQAFHTPSGALTHCLSHPTDVVLVDFSMPEMDGVSFIRELRAHARTRHVVAALVSGLPLAEFKAAAYDAGAVDVLTKPVVLPELRLKLAQLLRVAAGRREPVDLSAQRPFLHCLEQVALAQSDVPGKHTERVAAYAVAIAHHAGMPADRVALLGEAMKLHDLGRAAARSGADADRALAGYELLRDLPGDVFALAAEVALSQHERWDGKGGPCALAGEAIPLSGRIAAVADAFDRITAIEGRDPAWLITRAIAVIRADAGAQFDPAVVAAFLRASADLVAVKRHFDGDVSVAPRLARPHFLSVASVR